MNKHIHILGICGTYMAGVAILAKSNGYKVTGSDTNIYPPMSDYLKDENIEIISGYDIEQLNSNPDIILIGNTMKRGMPIVEHILSNKLNYDSAPCWISKNILKDKKVIAIAGTHGKTTTTSMVVKILNDCGFNPSFLIGGIIQDYNCSARLTDSDYFVIEADEYDTAFFDKRSKFFHYNPDVFVINNIEFDHADIFRYIDDIYRQFHFLIRTLPMESEIIYLNDDLDIKKIINLGCYSNINTFGFSDNSDNVLKSIFTNFSEIKYNNFLYKFPFIGRHNALNASAAITVAKSLGCTDEQCSNSLSSFAGPKRRLEVIYKNNNVVIYDDFAHHTTAISLTVEAVKNSYKNDNIIAIVELGTNTMKLGNNKESLIESLKLANYAVVFKNENELLQNEIHDKIKFSNNIENLLKDVVDNIDKNKNNKIIIMSNSSFHGIYDKLINKISQI